MNAFIDEGSSFLEKLFAQTREDIAKTREDILDIYVKLKSPPDYYHLVDGTCGYLPTRIVQEHEVVNSTALKMLGEFIDDLPCIEGYDHWFGIYSEPGAGNCLVYFYYPNSQNRKEGEEINVIVTICQKDDNHRTNLWTLFPWVEGQEGLVVERCLWYVTLGAFLYPSLEDINLLSKQERKIRRVWLRIWLLFFLPSKKFFLKKKQAKIF